MANRYSFPSKLLPSDRCIARPAMPFYYLSQSSTAAARSRGELRSPTLPSALRHFISDIIDIRSKKKVFGVHTNWIIAPVQYVKSFIKIIVNKLKGNSMGSGIFSFKPKLTIRKRLATTALPKPGPAFIGCFSVYFGPKTAFIRFFHAISVTQPNPLIYGL